MITLGRLIVQESDARQFEESLSSDGREVTLSGVMYSPQTAYARMQGFHDDVLNLQSRLIPVTFDRKPHRNAYYQVLSSKSQLTQLEDQKVIFVTWEATLFRLGAANGLDLESRLVSPSRLNDFELDGERWHAPPGGHRAYWSGTSQPAQVVRTGSEGPIRVYRGLAPNVNPRWNCPVEDYGIGRARFYDHLGAERVGTDFTIDTTLWTLDNSLIRVVSSDESTFWLGAHDGTGWEYKSYNITVNALPIGTPVSAVLLHNEYERVSLRLTFDQAPSGRYTVDFTIRRGARHVEITVQSLLSSILGVALATSEAGTAGSGFIRATSNDSAGNRYVIGSPKTFTGNLTDGGVSIAAVSRLYAFAGAEVGGSSAVAGDQAANIVDQYMAVMAEEVVGVNL